MENLILEVLMEIVLAQDADIYHGVKTTLINKVDEQIMALRKAIGDNVALTKLYENAMSSVKAICDEYVYCIFKKGVATGLNIWRELFDN